VTISAAVNSKACMRAPASPALRSRLTAHDAGSRPALAAYALTGHHQVLIADGR
jgi:hypothetical protein